MVSLATTPRTTSCTRGRWSESGKWSPRSAAEGEKRADCCSGLKRAARLHEFVTVSLRRHTLVLGSTGQLWAFGDGGRGQIGDGRAEDRLTPTLIQVDGAGAAATGAQ